MAYLIVVVICGLVLAVLLGGSYARIERALSYLAPTKGIVKVRTDRFGTLTILHVEEEDIVRAVDPLMYVSALYLTADSISIEAKPLKTLVEQRQDFKKQVTLEDNQLSSDLGRLRSELVSVELESSSFDTQKTRSRV